MSRQPKSTPEEDLRRLTWLLASIYVATTVGMIGVSLLMIQSIPTGVWIAVAGMTVLSLGIWWFYKRQIDAEIREASDARQARQQAKPGRSGKRG